MIHTQGLTHIHLIVSDLERSIDFNSGVFGMQEQFRDGPNMVFLNTPGTQDLITLNEDPEKAEIAGQSGGLEHFGFRLASSRDLERAVAEVESAGGKLISRGERSSESTFAYVEDPDGYVIELESTQQQSDDA